MVYTNLWKRNLTSIIIAEVVIVALLLGVYLENKGNLITGKLIANYDDQNCENDTYVWGVRLCESDIPKYPIDFVRRTKNKTYYHELVSGFAGYHDGTIIKLNTSFVKINLMGSEAKNTT